MKRNTLITGCNGFVAGYLIEELLKDNCNIYGFDLQENSRYKNVNYSNINLLEKDLFISYIQNNNITEIYHLAAIANTTTSHESPYFAIQTNIMGTLVLYEVCRQFKEIKLLVVGSSEMYQISPENMILKEDSPLKSHSIYGVTKISTELIGQEYTRQYNSSIIFTRSFNHTGPRQSASYVLSDWAKQCVLISEGKQEAIIKVGNISISRDFLDVRDVVKAYILLLRKGTSGEVYNVTSGNSYELEDLLNILIDFTGLKNISIKTDESRIRKNEPLSIKGSNEKIKKDTGWICQYSIQQTLNDLFHYWKKELSN